PKKPAKMEESNEMRYSLEIDEDIRKPLEDRAKKVAPPATGSQTSKTVFNLSEDTMYEGALGDFADRDDSFNAFERMCDKTGSDPNSTLFQYLHSEDKSQVVAMAKDRSVSRDLSANDQKEIDALRRMLEAVGTEDLLDNESPIKGVECTQLEDVEAPSRFWDIDHTLAAIDDSQLEPKTKISPVKMVGLLRPSTIIEDNETDISDISTQVSFQSARILKTNASSSYETATDSSLSGTLLNVDDLFYAAISKVKPPGMSKGEELELLSDLHGSLRELTNLAKDQDQNEAEDDFDVENTIIELSSSDDEDVHLISDVKQEDTSAMVEEKAEIKDRSADYKLEDILSLSADETNGKESKKSESEDKENASLHFNDTMEEMQYMMQKGMEYISEAAGAVPKPKSPELRKQNTFVLSPNRIHKSPATAFLESSLPLRISKKPQTLLFSPSKYKQPLKHELNMEWTRKKFFGASSGIPQRRQQQIKQSQFANIVSPIRTYTQKSGTAPLMALFRQTSADVFTSLAISELEQESRLCQQKPNFTAGANTSKATGFGIQGIDPTAQLLPKKAYISSEIKHVVDERTPMPMPNVPRIQKYLNSAVEPTVLRHDGKMKMPNETSRHPSTSHIPRRANHSLADLSLASGDVSLYTMRDAQKF
ncbi:hypothetical protein KR009_006753, partial [Drosophila setifemur]